MATSRSRSTSPPTRSWSRPASGAASSPAWCRRRWSSPIRSRPTIRAAAICWCSIRSTGRPTSTSTCRSAPSSRCCAAPTASTEPVPSDFLQPGTAQVAAGYAIYGPTTMLVMTLGDGVHGFTLDREIGAFTLTHPDMRIPAATREFAVNVVEPAVLGAAGAALRRGVHRGRRRAARRRLQHALDRLDGGRGAPHPDARRRVHVSARRKDPSRPGRLRLLYEANPMAMIVEQAGGAASTGRERCSTSCRPASTSACR